MQRWENLKARARNLDMKVCKANEYKTQLLELLDDTSLVQPGDRLELRTCLPDSFVENKDRRVVRRSAKL